ncbi:gamma-glutamyl-gamma-aminobutyrate hydrolase family protein [Microbacterium sp. NPDC019599]|uniref:gamma-glutamyl-gamma-aminobutyrate hydrolase family protein n=1 Tax=Microbacterium sp. NPDC019599 TaxID=3154690 RepID=UPI0033D356C0
MTPVVVSYSSSTPLHDAQFAQELRDLADVAGAAARDAGLEVRWVNAAAPDASPDDLVASSGGVIVLGGADVDPTGYGAAVAGAWMDSADAAADAFEAALMRAAIEASTPLLAICRGAQLLNVALGGTLVQDLGIGIHRDPDSAVLMVTHSVEVAAGTRLAAVVGAGPHDIRSGHHQAIHELGDGLVVSATAPDGVIEAVELAGDGWVVGVQWHPEDPTADSAHLAALLGDFAGAAQQLSTAH